MEKGIKFIPVDVDYKNKTTMLLIKDYKFFVQKQKDIVTWAKDSFGEGFSHQGMILEFNNSEDRLMFMMRWS